MRLPNCATSLTDSETLQTAAPGNVYKRSTLGYREDAMNAYGWARLSENGRKRALEGEARDRAWADKVAEEERLKQLLKANPADLNLDALRRRLQHQVRLGKMVTLQSRWRRFVFFWLRSEQRMAVAVKRPPGLSAPRLRVLEALVAEMRRGDRVRTCPYCRKGFERNGKQKFCTKAHAASYRKARWKRKHSPAAA